MISLHLSSSEEVMSAYRLINNCGVNFGGRCSIIEFENRALNLGIHHKILDAARKLGHSRTPSKDVGRQKKRARPKSTLEAIDEDELTKSWR